MKIPFILLFSFFLILTSCTETNRTEKTTKKKINEDSLKFSKLIAKFQDIQFDTLEVYSLNTINDSTYLFIGDSLDSLDLLLLPLDFTASLSEHMGYYACGKFVVNDTATALILRAPAEYDPSDIYLLYYNPTTFKLNVCMPLSCSFGDAGDVFIRNSWIIKQDSVFTIYTEELTEHYNVVDDPEDNTVTREQQRYKTILPSCEKDTLNDIQKDWPSEL